MGRCGRGWLCGYAGAPAQNRCIEINALAEKRIGEELERGRAELLFGNRQGLAFVGPDHHHVGPGGRDRTAGPASRMPPSLKERWAMTDTTNRSTHEIERELKRRRSEIARTADAIQDRLTPEVALDHALAYVRGPGGRRVLEAAQRNPLAVILAAIGIGWLLFGMREVGEDRRPGRPYGLKPQKPPPLVPGAGGPPSGTIKPAASASPGAVGGTTPL
jgi:hypothetical protein